MFKYCVMLLPITFKKFCNLSSFLNHAINEFDKVSCYIQEKTIRMSIRSVAQKVKQYKQEVDSQLGILRIKCGVKRKNNKQIGNGSIDNKNISDKKIIELCCNSEVFFSKAYNSVLNEYFPYQPLRDMLRYQLTGIRTAFRELKVFYSVMTRQIEATVVEC